MQDKQKQWSSMVRVAYGLGILPKDFWQLTAWEFEAILGPTELEAIKKEQLEKLKQQFPDRG